MTELPSSANPPGVAADDPAVPNGEQPQRRTWLAPALATVLLIPLAPAAYLFGMLSGLAIDGCDPDCSDALMTSLSVIEWLIRFGGLITLVSLIAAWALAEERRRPALRRWCAVVSLLPPLAVLFLVWTLPAS